MGPVKDGRERWEKHLPLDLGDLPVRGRLIRTDPQGTTPAPIAIVGLYPAVTRTGRWKGRAVPVEVEARSFEGSKSAAELKAKYMKPLGLAASEVFLIDLYPYYLANVVKGSTGRSMWDNVRAYQQAERKALGVEGRPDPDAMVRKCRDLPGNLERLAWWFDLCRPSLVITLGAEAAAFARGDFETGAAARARDLLYTEESTTTAFGARAFRVVHCAHPGILMREKTKKWNDDHEAWCKGAGLEKVATARRAHAVR